MQRRQTAYAVHASRMRHESNLVIGTRCYNYRRTKVNILHGLVYTSSYNEHAKTAISLVPSLSCAVAVAYAPRGWARDYVRHSA